MIEREKVVLIMRLRLYYYGSSLILGKNLKNGFKIMISEIILRFLKCDIIINCWNVFIVKS